MAMIQFAHTNIITDDWRSLADFYIKVFGCKPLMPERDLKGDWLDYATNIGRAHIQGIHLALPGYDDKLPTLEIFQYDVNLGGMEPLVNRKGFGHIAFRVENVGELLTALLEHGGTQLGEMVEQDIPGAGHLTFVYAQDPDGNIIELQNWR
jgi:catechol 2,3-dioxygenase-like lactoylglutathione lyase family enzyme